MNNAADDAMSTLTRQSVIEAGQRLHKMTMIRQCNTDFMTKGSR